MINITIRFGGETCSRSFAAGTTVSQVLADPTVRASLGYGDSLRALINGVEVPGTSIAPDGGTILVETRSNSKAV